MLASRSLYWTLVVLVLAIIQPAVSHPISTPKWMKTTQFENRDSRGVWKGFKKHEEIPLSQLSQAVSTQSASTSTIHETSLERGQPGRNYKRDTISDKPIVSVLVPKPLISEKLDRHWKHPQAEHYESPWKNTAPSTKHYGEVLGNKKAKVETTGFHRQETQSSTSSLRLSSGNYISIFSYRISFPFLKVAQVSFPQFPLPQIFTTVMILLALVWIAILAIGLAEVGNYLWKRVKSAWLAGESREVAKEDSTGRVVELKEPFQVPVVLRLPRREAAWRHENEFLSSSSESDTDSSGMDDSRMP
ncbi:hypothetical protein N7520_010061 [Penicillium odoratum]|uniref:uncharacterized protein n=1 Tax=Penicillium odoratum TaxID=1167516 RepID=UPI00254740B9|nr:uncharacterized protein N7520_010061 [Penicillium odoratum]KAJ5753144.1 hypothetical protein N7520_010061 [Penicillium odoratum]